MSKNFTALIEKDTESGLFVGTVPCLIGAHTCAKTLDELQEKLCEIVLLCLEELDAQAISELPEFSGITQISVAV